MKNLIPLILLFIASSCAVTRKYNPARKFSPQELQEDYQVFRNILEESHPSLYWYTPKDSIDYYFNVGAAKLKDSLPEYKFRYVLSYVLSQIRCGHTSVKASRQAVRYAERTRSFSFPLSVKVWEDTVMVTGNLNRKDSSVRRGALIRAIEGHPVTEIIDTFFKHLSGDGYNLTHKYQTISNPGVFRSMYGAIYGLHPKMNVEYADTSGNIKTAGVPVYNPVLDTPKALPPGRLLSKRDAKVQTILSTRSLRIDSSLHTAFMEVNSFTRDSRLRRFFKRSFKKFKKEHISNLVVDVRGNGGGSVNLSNLLTAYIADKPFKIADSLYAVKRRSSYGRYIQNYFFNRLFFFFMTRKRSDGHYHFTYFENRHFRIKKKNHFNGQVYIVTGGNTFSAATLFARVLKGQSNVTIIGEETGGSAYGNTAWLIPDVTLPHTKVRFRLPLLRLVIDKNDEKGRGVLPDVEAKPTVDAILHNKDYKMDKVIELIKRERVSDF